MVKKIKWFMLFVAVMVLISGCISTENQKSKDVHLIEGEISIYPPYLQPGSTASLKLELRNMGYGSVFIHVKGTDGEFINPRGACIPVGKVSIYPPLNKNEHVLEIRENQNKLFTWNIKGADAIGREDKCTVEIDIPYEGKTTYVKYIPVINENEVKEDTSMIDKFKGSEIKEEHSNVDVEVYVSGGEPIIVGENGKDITFQIRIKNKGEEKAEINYDFSSPERSIMLSLDENIVKKECRLISHHISKGRESKIELRKGESMIIECTAHVNRPKISAKYRIQVEVKYKYHFKRSVTIPVKADMISGKLSVNIPLSSKGGDFISELGQRTMEAILGQVISGVVSHVLGISSRDLSDSLQKYVSLHYGPLEGKKKAQEKLASDSEYIAKKIFVSGELSSSEGTCKGKDVVDTLKDEVSDVDNICSPEYIEVAFEVTGCDKVIIANGDEYWNKEIDDAFERERERIINSIREGVKEGIESNGNRIVEMYRDKILDDVRVRLSKKGEIRIDMDRVVNMIGDRLLGQLVDTMTKDPVETAYRNYHNSFKRAFIEEYNANIVSEVARYASTMCSNYQGLFEELKSNGE